MFFFLRPGRIIRLAILLAVVFGGWWIWQRLHSSSAASAPAAVASLRKAHGTATGVPAPGVYRYRSTGSERIGIGPLTVRRTLPGQALVVVRPVTGGVRLVSTELSGDHAEGWRVEPTPDGWVGSYRSLSIGTVGYTRTIAGNALPTVLLVPAKLKVGQTWSSNYTVQGIVFQRDSKVTAKDIVMVGGVAYRVFVLSTRETVTGTLHGVDTLKEWWSPDLGLDLKLDWQRDLNGTIVNIASASLSLLSTTPAR